MYKKLTSPEFKITTEKYVITSGVEVECFSSREAKSDWCRCELTTQLQEAISYDDMEKVIVELGYEDDYDVLINGYIRKMSKDYWKEIMIRDNMIKLDRTEIKATFELCDPQDIIKYVLTQAGIMDYKLSDKNYGKKDVFIVNRQNCVKTILEVNSIWGIDNDFFFRDNIFYWGTNPEQEYTYILEESENILSLNKYGDLWEIETFGVPWIHHSQMIEVIHSKKSGTFKVEKTIVRSDGKGRTRMYIYFSGG